MGSASPYSFTELVEQELLLLCKLKAFCNPRDTLTGFVLSKVRTVAKFLPSWHSPKNSTSHQLAWLCCHKEVNTIDYLGMCDRELVLERFADYYVSSGNCLCL
jgi:hypothetical protein